MFAINNKPIFNFYNISTILRGNHLKTTEEKIENYIKYVNEIVFIRNSIIEKKKKKAYNMPLNEFCGLNPVVHFHSKQIDFGVMAIKNIVAGDVVETKEALTPQIELFDTLDLPIHHCLFKKSPQSNIEYVASHIQALHQTQETRKKILKNVIEIECTDTALAAKMLFNGEYPENYAVICRENAGNFFNLTLVAKNIEDNPFNTTTFGLFKLKIR